jgi:mono/diheme cytochrome c family protein
MNRFWLFSLFALVTPALAEDIEAVQKGHALAVAICAYCHVVEPGDPNPPVLHPPGPPFAEIASRGDVTIDAVEAFLHTTLRDVKAPKGMSNPQLADFRIKAIAAYVLSLRQAK